uniref:Uncharacterized protein n=1 Tax=Rhizophora mucronata TaxID=61149 RepID=A0A2P2J3A7_RHIMU
MFHVHGWSFALLTSAQRSTSELKSNTCTLLSNRKKTFKVMVYSSRKRMMQRLDNFPVHLQ